jgi:hypothetical protein
MCNIAAIVEPNVTEGHQIDRGPSTPRLKLRQGWQRFVVGLAVDVGMHANQWSHTVYCAARAAVVGRLSGVKRPITGGSSTDV